MRLGPLVAIATLAALAGGCTSISTTTIPWQRGGRETFVTTSDLTEPYQSVGLLQATRRGVLLFGFLDPAGANVGAAMQDLLPQARLMGGDGVINLRFEQTDYPMPIRLIFAVLFFIPLPAEANVRGEVVKLGAQSPQVPHGF
jgi:hypothetical protein